MIVQGTAAGSGGRAVLRSSAQRDRTITGYSFTAPSGGATFRVVTMLGSTKVDELTIDYPRGQTVRSTADALAAKANADLVLEFYGCPPGWTPQASITES